jgi:predicted Zn-dependent protease
MKRPIIVAGSLAVLVGVLGLWFYGRPAYRHHKEAQFLERTRQFIAQGDFRNANLSARQTLQVNPLNLDASRIMAELAEMARSPAALDWRRRIVVLTPTLENKLLLASTAIKAQGPPCPLATQTLDELSESAKGVAAFHVLSAELALKLNKPTEAATHFEEAKKLEPNNELHRLNLAVLGLNSTNSNTSSEARAELERLRTNPNVGAVALRWLVSEKLRTKDLAGAEDFSRQLLADPRANLDDRLQHLRILKETNPSEFQTYLSALQKDASTNAVQIFEISAWMVAHGMSEEGMRWLTNCPTRIKTEQPVPLALVDCYVGRKDWPGLESFLQQSKWTELEFLRQAYLSRAAAEQKQTLAAETRWRSAVREAGDRLGPLTALLNLAGSWGREKAREDVLWMIGQRFPSERWAFREIERQYLIAGNTRGLNKLYSTMAAYDPKNYFIKNNLAATSMLLKVNLASANDMAREVYNQHPDEPIVASTFAYSLHLQGRTKEGLATLDKLKPEALETPAVALYYGILLSASGETNHATKYLACARKPDLLPEEKALLAQADKDVATH